jgi:hypothetical protein
MVTDDFYYKRNIDSKEEFLSPMHSGVMRYSKQQQDSARKKLSEFTNAFYETAKYMIMNNKKE